MSDDIVPTFPDLFKQQVSNQVTHYAGDPIDFGDAEHAEYVTWNALAIQLEIAELTELFSWKPWSKDRGGIRPDPFKVAGEIADVLCFMTNLARTAGVSADDLMHAWDEKIARNRKRQEESYDVKSRAWKCPVCGEELDRTKKDMSVCAMDDQLKMWHCVTQGVYKKLEGEG